MLKVVIDASTLISLAKIRSLDALENLNAQILCPLEVKKEAIDEGIGMHFDDAFEIQKSFKKNLVKAVEIYGAPNADFAVLDLAKKTNAGFILCNDIGLSRKAAGMNIQAMGSADIFYGLHKNGRLSRAELRKKLKALVAKKRLSARNFALYLKR